MNAEQVRAAFPICTAFATLIREFDPTVRMLYASENGRSIGKPQPAGVVPILPLRKA